MSLTPAPRRPSWRQTYLNATSIPYWGAHVAAVIAAVKAGFSWSGLLWTATVYFLGMFFVTAGYHRYFAHRSYKTSRWFQLVLAIGSQATAQKGVLWWAANHRHHHKFSDQPEDAHSPVQDGFWWSHCGWFLSNEFRSTDETAIRDLCRYPELRFLNHPAVMLLPGLIYLGLCTAIAGVHGLAWGALIPVVLVWHGTYTINSLAHVIGVRRYESNDQSKNSLILALMTLGEGWHNNHHHYQRATRQGFHWYQIDITYYVLWLLSKLGIVWGLHTAPAHVVNPETAAATSEPSLGVAQAARDVTGGEAAAL